MLLVERVGEIELRDPRPRDREVVYFAQAEHGGPIKIGVTRANNVAGRLASIQTGNPYLLVARRLVAWDGGSVYALEKELHAHFRGYRLSGEWFAPAPDLLVLAKASEGSPKELEVIEEARKMGIEEGYAEGWDVGFFEGRESAEEAVLKSLGRRDAVRPRGAEMISNP